jgi:hypothetical protein
MEGIPWQQAFIVILTSIAPFPQTYLTGDQHSARQAQHRATCRLKGSDAVTFFYSSAGFASLSKLAAGGDTQNRHLIYTSCSDGWKWMKCFQLLPRAVLPCNAIPGLPITRTSLDRIGTPVRSTRSTLDENGHFMVRTERSGVGGFQPCGRLFN